jgi:hypothetical protein
MSEPNNPRLCQGPQGDIMMVQPQTEVRGTVRFAFGHRGADDLGVIPQFPSSASTRRRVCSTVFGALKPSSSESRLIFLPLMRPPGSPFPCSHPLPFVPTSASSDKSTLSKKTSEKWVSPARSRTDPGVHAVAAGRDILVNRIAHPRPGTQIGWRRRERHPDRPSPPDANAQLSRDG